MTQFHAFLVYSLCGAPVWAWLALVTLGVVEYALPRVPWPRARSIGELVANALAKVLGRFPVLGPALSALGTPSAPAAPTPPPGSSVRVLLPLAFVALLVSGCAHGTDGLRQACANEMDVAAAAFRSADAWYAPKLAAFKASTEARDQFAADTALYEKVRAGIKAAGAIAAGQCAVADAVDAGGKGDVAAATAAVGQAVAQIGAALAAITPLLPGASGSVDAGVK
jgi:hypothetical protein